jgi:hypothetical protein
MGSEDEKTEPAADVDPVSLVAFRFDPPATARK